MKKKTTKAQRRIFDLFGLSWMHKILFVRVINTAISVMMVLSFLLRRSIALKVTHGINTESNLLITWVRSWPLD